MTTPPLPHCVQHEDDDGDDWREITPEEFAALRRDFVEAHARSRANAHAEVDRLFDEVAAANERRLDRVRREMTGATCH